MPNMSLPGALIREHRNIDTGIETFIATLDHGTVVCEPLLSAFEALRRHIYLEETFLFPPIRQAGVLMPLLVMVREHGNLWQLMNTITALLEDHDSARSVDGQAADDDVASTCRILLAQLEQHNSKEEPIIYPHADKDLSAEATTTLAEFIRTGSTPQGWICEAAPQRDRSGDRSPGGMA